MKFFKKSPKEETVPPQGSTTIQAVPMAAVVATAVAPKTVREINGLKERQRTIYDTIEALKKEVKGINLKLEELE